MSSFIVKFRSPSSVSQEGMVYYRIIHKRNIRQITTNYKMYEKEWKMLWGELRKEKLDNERREYLETIKRKVVSDKKYFDMLICKLSIQNGEFSVDEVVEKVKKIIFSSSLFEFMEGVILRYRQNNQIRTSETYQSTLNSIKRFRKNRDIYLMDLNSDFIGSYAQYLSSQGIQHNTISFYMHRLRAIYNRAVSDEYIEQSNPFKHLKISIERTSKRAISVNYIKKLKALYLDEFSSKCFARDMFLFSFYTRGMSFVDIAYLQKKDVNNGVLIYRRKKTSQKLQIRWESCMQEIVDRYALLHNSSPFLFPVIDVSKNDARKQYHNALTMVNRNLKIIGNQIGLKTPLTMYVARHSWATIAHSEGFPISVISEGLGHDNERTTQIYLASLDNSVIDDANSKIINLL